jgi:hypothetical protein
MSLKKIALLLMVFAAVFAFYSLAGCNPTGKKGRAPLTITTTSLPPGQAGTAYTYTLEATGGQVPYTWSIEETGSTLPPGLYLSESGNITGTPTTDGSYSFTVKVTDAHNDPRVDSKNMMIEVYPLGEVRIVTAALAPAYVSQAYEGQLQAVGGTLPYIWEIVSGGYLGSTFRLTEGLYLSKSGLVTGTPIAKDVKIVEVQVEDSTLSLDTREITITIYDPQLPLSITTASPLPNAQNGVAYDYQLVASGGVVGTGYVWAEELGSAPLPPGISLTVDGLLTGTPSVAPPIEFSFSLQVTDKAIPTPTTVTKVFKVTVVP